MSDMAVGWDRDLGGVFIGRALREQPRYNGANGMGDPPSPGLRRAKHGR
jgi:hypothetical protein